MRIIYILLFSAVILNSCSSSKDDKSNALYKYKFTSEEQFDQLELLAINNEEIEFQLKHLESKGVTFWFEMNGKAINKYPEGDNLLTELDPSGSGQPIKLYEYDNDKTKVNILVPVLEAEKEVPYLNIEVEYKSHDTFVKYERMLVLFDE